MQENTAKVLRFMGRGGGLVVSVLAFYSDDTSSIPALATLIVQKEKKMKKRSGLAHL